MYFIKFSLKSLSIKVLQVYINFIKSIFSFFHLKVSIFFLPKKIKKITLLKSPHVYKKAREQFEQKKYKVLVVVKISNKTLINNLLKILIINKPFMVLLKIKN